MKKDLEQIKLDALKYPDQAKELKIVDDISLHTASNFLVSIRKLRKEINEAFNPIIEKAHAAHKEALSTKKRFDQPLIEAELIVKPQISNYMAMLARKQREAEAAAEKAEEEKRLKEEKQLAAAIEAEDSGDLKKRDEIMEEITPEVAPVEYATAPKLKGTSIRKIWKWRVIDINIIPREYLIVNPNMITTEMRKSKGDTNIPGIQVYSEDSVATRIS